MAAKKLLPAMVAGLILTGCQVTPQAQPEPEVAPQKPARMHLHLSEASASEGDITHVVQDISLVKAVKHVYPDASLLPDPGINMQSRVSLWAENVTEEQYLDQLGRAAGLVIQHDEGTVTLSSVERWNFTLPALHIENVREMLASTPRSSMTVVENDSEVATILVTAPPSQLPALRTAVFQLSDQSTLNDTFTKPAAPASHQEG